jgi:hypothetical protein
MLLLSKMTNQICKKPYIGLAKKKCKMQNGYLIGRAKKKQLNVAALFKGAILFLLFLSPVFSFFPKLFPLFLNNFSQNFFPIKSKKKIIF